MRKSNILNIINDANDDSIYLSDIDTYELIYLSPAACAVTGCSPTNYQGKPCYKILQGLDSPCPFCTNHLLSETDFYTWEHDNTALQRRFMLRDRLVRYRGRLVRMEIATDITDKRNDFGKMLQLHAIDESLHLCIDTLKNIDDTELAISRFLAEIGRFYKAAHTCIYEADAEAQVLNATYSWNEADIRPPVLPPFPFSFIARWIEAFDKDGFLCIESVPDEMNQDFPGFLPLHSQGVRNLIAVPLFSRTGQAIGFISVHNPKANIDAPSLLRSVSTFVVDAISKRAMLDKLDKLNYTDALTGLYNRKRYIERIQELRDAPPSCLGIISLDIDGMKQANDTYGHSYGDAMLVQIANILTHICSYEVYRTGGDEFVALCPDIRKEDFQYLTERLRAQIKAEMDLSVSIGTKWTQGATDAMEQIVDADHLMGMEKRAYYNAMRAKHEAHHAQLKQKLLAEIHRGEFTVLLQPQIHLETGTIAGAEALVRKRGVYGELLSPSIFIPFYEKEGLIEPIDFFVLKTVCQTIRDWKKAKLRPPTISVNFSRLTLLGDGFVENLCGICQQYGIAPERIDVEMTESISKMDMQVLSALVKRLRKIGFSVSLDDFGTRYSNLAILTSIDFDSIKIDKSLVDHIVSNPKSRVIVEHMIRIGKELNQIGAVAEGIETDEQFHALKHLDCDVGQGFYFSKPLPIHEFCSTYLTM